MKSLTIALILLAFFPEISCPFHGFFFEDDESSSDAKALIGNIKDVNPRVETEIKPHPFFQFKDFKAQLKQWKEEKREPQKESSLHPSQTFMAERSKPTESLNQQ